MKRTSGRSAVNTGRAVRRGVNEHFQGVVDEGSRLIKKYDLYYETEEEEW